MRKFLSVLLALMMVVSTVSFAVPSAVTTDDSATNAVAENATEVTTEIEEANLFADDTWYDKTKGTLLFNMDFDENNSGNAVTSAAAANVTNAAGSFNASSAAPVSGLGRLNPDLTTSDYSLGFRYATHNTAAIVTEGDNKYFTLNAGTSDNVSFYLGKPFQKAGKYVLELKYKYVPTSGSGKTLSSIDCNSPSNGVVKDVVTGEWGTFSKEYNVTGASDVRLRFLVTGGYCATTDLICFDDIKVWYFDESADYDTLVGQKYVTVYSGRDDLENQVIPVPAGTTVTMQQVMEMVSTELPGCLGFAETADGDILPLDTVITIDSNKTFYAVWGFDASVSANGNENVSDLTVSGIDTRVGITVAELISKIDVSASTRPLLGISATADGVVLATSTVITSADTLYMIWGAESIANKWYDEEMGTRIFFIDLDGDNGHITNASLLSRLNGRLDGVNDHSASNGMYIEQIGRFNPAFDGMYDSVMKYSFKDGGTPTITEVDGNKYFTHTSTTAPSVMVSDPFVGAGTYTLVFDHAENKTFKYQSGWGSSGTCPKTPVDGTWERTVYSVTATAVGTNDHFRLISNNGAGTYLIDNVALYFKPTGKLDLTIAGNVYSVDAGTYTASELVDIVKSDIPTCVGFSKTEGGEVFSGDETIDVLVNTTLYAIAGFDVTLKANDNAEFSDVTLTGFNSMEGVTVGELISKIENDTDRLVRGLSETADGALLSKDTEINEAKTLYIIWTVDESTLGTLIFNIDFEKDGIEAPANGSSTSINDLTDIFNSDLVPDGIKLSLERLNATSLESENGNTYFASSNQTDSRFKVNINEFETGFKWTNGTYTLVVDVKMGASATASFDNMTAVDSFANEVGEWDRVTYNFNDTFSNSVNDSGEPYGTKSFGFAAAAGTSVALDNIKLYFKTDETTITVRNGGNDDITDTVVNVNTTTGITVEEIIAEVNKQETNRTLLGISTEPTGELLALSEVITPKYPIYLYAIWNSKDNNPYVDDKLGHMLFEVDFEREEVIDANWNGYAELDNTANPSAGDKITNIASYYNPMLEGENARLMVRIDTSVSASNATVGIGSSVDGNHYIEGTSQHQYPKVQFLNNANLVLEDGIYTMYVDAMSTGSGSISYQYAGDNCKLVEGDNNGDGKWDFTPGAWTTYGLSFEVTDGAVIPNAQINFSHSDMGHTIAFDNVKLYYKPFRATITLNPGTLNGFGTHTVENISTTGENTGNDLVAAIQGKLDVAGVEFVGLMDEYGDMIDLSKSLVIPGDVTYTIVWGEANPIAPVTQEKNAIRYSTKEESRGIRFVANIDKTVVEIYSDSVTEYGWIITRPELLEEKGVSPYAFTKETVLRKPVIVGKNYGFQNTGDKDADRKHFDEDDETLIITAVVYGLAPKNYKNDLLVRPYIVVDGVTYYGKPWQRSMYDTAVALRDNGYPDCDDTTKAYVDEIINNAV